MAHHTQEERVADTVQRYILRQINFDLDKVQKIIDFERQMNETQNQSETFKNMRLDSDMPIESLLLILEQQKKEMNKLNIQGNFYLYIQVRQLAGLYAKGIMQQQNYVNKLDSLLDLAQQYIDRLTIYAEKQILEENNSMIDININSGLTQDVKIHLMHPHYCNIRTINLQKVEAQCQVLERIKQQLEELKLQFECDQQIFWNYPTDVYRTSEDIKDKLEFVNIQTRGLRYGYRDLLLKQKQILEVIKSQQLYILELSKQKKL